MNAMESVFAKPCIQVYNLRSPIGLSYYKRADCTLAIVVHCMGTEKSDPIKRGQMTSQVLPYANNRYWFR